MHITAPRFKGLSQAEIDKLMNEYDAENYADSDSDFEFDNLEESVICPSDDNSNEETIEIPQKRENFVWKESGEEFFSEERISVCKSTPPT